MAGPPPLPTKTFDFNLVTVTWGALVLTGGLESIKFSRAEDGWSTHVSADGTVTRVRNNNTMGNVTLVYGQNATALNQLSQQAQLDEALGGGAAPIEVKDGSGTTLATAPLAWVKKFADAEFQKEGTTREWSLDCDHLTVFIGGLI